MPGETLVWCLAGEQVDEPSATHQVWESGGVLVLPDQLPVVQKEPLSLPLANVMGGNAPSWDCRVGKCTSHGGPARLQ
ncbi:MAG: hypothetical protein CM1200mP2_47920 [Planctomycetaceae bacterium]|nr:MAG: hypothetical protein CM1200mP2_47920 [Planctomycetaceae bacterium]